MDYIITKEQEMNVSKPDTLYHLAEILQILRLKILNKPSDKVQPCQSPAFTKKAHIDRLINRHRD